MKTMNPHEAIVAFCAWLTTREDVTTMGSSELCDPIPKLVGMFAESQNLPPVRNDFGDRIATYPEGAPQ